MEFNHLLGIFLFFVRVNCLAPLTEIQSASAISAIVIGSIAAAAITIGCAACGWVIYKAETEYNEPTGRSIKEKKALALDSLRTK